MALIPAADIRDLLRDSEGSLLRIAEIVADLKNRTGGQPVLLRISYPSAANGGGVAVECVAEEPGVRDAFDKCEQLYLINPR